MSRLNVALTLTAALLCAAPPAASAQSPDPPATPPPAPISNPVPPPPPPPLAGPAPAPTPDPPAPDPQLPLSGGEPPPKLTQIYRGDDGGALYLRAEGATVVGFAEHPVRKYAFVFRGTRTADIIDGRWYDIAKGTRTTIGAIKLKVFKQGDRLVRNAGTDFGPDVFEAIDPAKVPRPGGREAGFQSQKRLDLDGAFAGTVGDGSPDGARYYWRETSDGAFGVGEVAAHGSGGPPWVSVFVGKRDASGGLEGEYFDVPKGNDTQRGSFRMGPFKPEYGRRYSLQQFNAAHAGVFGRSTGIDADYAYDFDKMAASFDKYFRGNVVGFGYAISHTGKVVRSDGGGNRYLSTSDEPFDLNQQFNQFVASDIGSSTKLIVATAVIRELAKRKMQITSKVAEYFPSCWKLAADMKTLTFKDLIDHNAGLARINGSEKAKLMKKDSTGYLYQRTVAERGRTGPKEYYNQHYVHLGWVLAGLLDKPKVEALFAKHGCGKGTKAMVKTMEIFEAHVLHMLKDQGVRASWKRSKLDLRAWGYNFADQSIPGALSAENINPSGGLKMTAQELGEFMAKLDTGVFVDRATVWQMKRDKLGGGPFGLGDHGWGFTKNGGAPVGKGRGYGSQVTLLPGGVQIVGVWNSSKNSVTGGVPTAMVTAWKAGIK